MKTTLEGVILSVTTRKNALPEKKPAVGRLLVAAQEGRASFEEDEDARIVSGDPKGVRVMRGRNAAVYWRPEEDRFKICVFVSKEKSKVLDAELATEECFSFIKQAIINGKY